MQTQAQTVTVPGANTSNDPNNTTITRKPFGNYFGYERSAMIYLGTDINTSGNITSVAFYVESVNTPAASTPVVIYMKQTAATAFTGPTLVSDEEANATPVFSGNILSSQLTPGAWTTVTLTTPFNYSSTATASNLEIIVETNGGGSGIEPNPNSKQFRVSNTGSNQLQYWQNDGTPPSAPGILDVYRPNVQLTFGSATQTCDVPTNPAAPSASITSTSASITFTPSSGAGGTYIVEYGPSGFTPGTGATAGTGGTVVTGSGSPINLTGLNPNTTYQFYIRKNCTTSSSGFSANTSVSQFTTAAAATCAAPTSVTGTATGETTASITFSGGDYVSGNSYVVEYGPAPFTPGSGTTTSALTTQPAQLTGLTPGTTYGFVVRITCTNGQTSANSTAGSFTTDCAAASGLAVSSITNNSATLSFNNSSGTGTYSVQVGLAGFAFGSGTPVSGPPYTASGLNPSTSYDFVVRKNCSGGNVADSRINFSTTAAPVQTCAAPTAVSATNPTDNSVQINFSGGDASTSYTLQYGPTSTFPTSGTTLASMSGSPFTLTGLNASTAYSFVVRTNCSNGVTSANSPTGTFTTTAPPATCNTPTNFSVTNITNNSAQINFTPSGGTTGSYIIEYALAGSGNWNSQPPVSSSPFNLGSLNPNTSYDVRMYKDCASGGTSNFTPTITFTTTSTAGTCDAPTNPAVSIITNNTAQVSFTESTTGSGGVYIVEYGPAGFTPGTGAVQGTNGTIVNTNNSPANLTGLAASTSYDVYVRKQCSGSSFSANTAKVNFSTTATPVCTAGTWLGTTSNSWHTASNWCNNQIPTASTNVVIPSGTPNSPEITQDAFANNLTIDNGATLTQNGGTGASGVTLTIAGKFTNNGTFTNTGNGSIAFTGSASQIIGESGQTTTLYDLTVGPGGGTLGGPVGVRHLLTLNGNLNTNSQTFTLIANSTDQAMVINNSGIVSGTTKVQRYINPGLNSGIGYRHLSTPVSNTTVNDINDPGVNLVVNPAYNASPTPSTVRPFPTIFLYNEARLTPATATTSSFDFGWESPASLSDPILIGRGYTVNMPPLTIDFNGTLNNGNITVSSLTRGATANSGWLFLGNPYPAPIDWNKVTIPGDMDNAVYVWRSSGQYTGSYISYVNGVGGLNTNLIAACQGFFVRANANAAPFSFTFTNAMRATTYQNPAFYRQGQATETRPLVSLALQNANGQKDNLYVYFENGATPAFDGQFDAFKLPNPGTAPILYSMANNDALSINGLPLPVAGKAVPLVAYVNAAGSYTFSADQLLNFGTTSVILEDHLAGTSVNLNSQSVYTFSTSQTDLTGRFTLRFGPATTTGIAEPELAAQTVVYPNPSKGSFTISMPLSKKSTVNAKVYNVVGQQIWERTFNPVNSFLQEKINLDKLPAGIYTIRLETKDGLVQKKLIIE